MGSHSSPGRPLLPPPLPPADSQRCAADAGSRFAAHGPLSNLPGLARCDVPVRAQLDLASSRSPEPKRAATRYKRSPFRASGQPPSRPRLLPHPNGRRLGHSVLKRIAILEPKEPPFNELVRAPRKHPRNGL